MASPFSVDLRQRILHACERGTNSQRQIAEFFGVSLGFVEKLLRQMRQTGEIAARRQGGGPPSRITPEVREHMRHLVQMQPDITLVELVERLAQDCEVHAGPSTVSRLLKKLGLARKKSNYTPVSATRPRYVRRARNTGRRSPDFPRNA